VQARRAKKLLTWISAGTYLQEHIPATMKTDALGLYAMVNRNLDLTLHACRTLD
jgi:hypothetical protein